MDPASISAPGEVLNLPAILPVTAFHVDLINDEVVVDLVASDE